MEDPTALSAFERIDMRVGTIVAAEPFPEARKPAYRLRIDFGEPIGVRVSSAQITQNYEAAALVGMQIVAVVNFPHKRIAGFISEVLVLGIPDAAGNVVLLQPAHPVPNGGGVY